MEIAFSINPCGEKFRHERAFNATPNVHRSGLLQENDCLQQRSQVYLSISHLLFLPQALPEYVRQKHGEIPLSNIIKT